MDSTTLSSPLETLNPKKAICVDHDASLKSVIHKMKEHGIGCVCVVEKNWLVGIFTERDILKKVVCSNLNLEKTQVKEVMTANPEYLFMDDEIAFALNRMHVGGFRHIPLVNLQYEPQGVISVRDIAAHLIQN